MNFIILEGISLYLFLILLILLFLISLGCLIYSILADRRICFLENLLEAEKRKVQFLNKRNLILKIKCGEFEFYEE